MAGLANLGHLDTWRRELAPTPRRIKDTLRTTIACTTAALLAQIFHLDQGFWAIITILVLAPPTAAASLRKAATRLGGTIAGCLVGVASVSLFGQQPPLQLATIFLAITTALYFASGRVAPYSFFVAAFTMAIVTYSAVQNPEAAGTIAWRRFTEIALGVLVSGASHLVLWPLHADAELRRAIADKILHATENLEPLSARLRGEGTAVLLADPRPDERLSAHLDLLDLTAGLHEAIYRHHLAWESVIGLVEAFRLATFECGRLSAAPSASRGLLALGTNAESSIQELNAQAIALAAAIRNGERVTVPALPPLDRLDTAFTTLRRSGATASWTREEVSGMAATIEALRTAWMLIARLAPTVCAAGGFEPDTGRIDVPRSVMSPLLPLDRDRLRSALKGGFASTLSIVLGAALHWTLGTTATATCVVLAATVTLGSLVQKSGLRLLGSIVGGVLALLVLMWIIPIAEGPAALLALSFIVLLPCIYLLGGSDRVSYLGLQAAFAFSIGVLGPLRPTIDLWTPTSRILGVVVGIVIFSLVFVLLWPNYATRQFRRSAAQVLRILREIMLDALNASPNAAFVTLPRQRRLYDSIASTMRLLSEAEYEDPGSLDLDRLRGLDLVASLRLLTRHAILWRQVRHGCNASFPVCETVSALAHTGEVISARLETLAEAIASGVEPALDPALTESMKALDAATDHDRAARCFAEWPTPVVDALFACVEHARAMSELLARAHDHGVALQIPRSGLVAYASPAS